jgi:hypothetical protein
MCSELGSDIERSAEMTGPPDKGSNKIDAYRQNRIS